MSTQKKAETRVNMFTLIFAQFLVHGKQKDLIIPFLLYKPTDSWKIEGRGKEGNVVWGLKLRRLILEGFINVHHEHKVVLETLE